MLDLFFHLMQYMLLTIMALQDAQTHYVSLIYVVLFCLCSIFFIKLENIFIIGLISIVLIGFSRYRNNVALADIFLIMSCSLMLELEYIGIFLIMLGLVSSIFGLYKYLAQKLKYGMKTELRHIELPLVPFILISYFITSILLYIG